MSSLDPNNINAVFKAYDVRGTVPDQIDEDLARATGRAFVQVLGNPERIVIGEDMRPSSPALARAYAEGATSAGADVVMIGLCSTDELYFASGYLGIPGVMFTASHNPAQYNGIKMCRASAVAIGQDSGLAEIRERAEVLLAEGMAPSSGAHSEQIDLLGPYAEYLRGLVDLAIDLCLGDDARRLTREDIGDRPPD